MKPVADMSPEELAGWVCEALCKAAVTVTLSGGACVGIWSEGKYVSNDLDFVEEGPVPRRKIREVLKRLGFAEKGRHFVHADTKFYVEFPTGPLMVGDQRVESVVQRITLAGTLRLLSPTDCVKDRLAAFFTGTIASRSRRQFLLQGCSELIYKTSAVGPMQSEV